MAGILEGYLRGVEGAKQIANMKRQNELSGLRNLLAGQVAEGGFNPSESLDFQQYSVLDPQGAAATLANYEALDDSRKRAMFQDAQEGLRLLESGRDQDFLDLAVNRNELIKKFKGDSSDTESVINSFLSGDRQGVIQQLKLMTQAGIERGYLADPLERDERKARIQAQRRGPTKTANQKDLETFERLISEAEASGTEKDRKKAERFGRKAGFIRETEQEKADIKVDAAMRKTVAESNAERKQGFIDSGIQAADGVANLNRALSLLDEVKTGGFDNVALKAKRLFGVEGADEGELSNLMGKAVLAQLKPIFGAAFTAREGEALAELEAKFSNSPANNRRLIENALRLADRAARRGIAAAEDQGDMFTANEIKEAMSFNLRDKLSDSTPKAPQPTPAPNQFEGFRIIRK
jgi:hypothetical protein